MVSVNVHCKLIACMTVHRNCNHARVTNVFIKKLKCLSKHFDLLTIWIDKSSSSYRKKKKNFFPQCREYCIFSLIIPYTVGRLDDL